MISTGSVASRNEGVRCVVSCVENVVTNFKLKCKAGSVVEGFGALDPGFQEGFVCTNVVTL